MVVSSKHLALINKNSKISNISSLHDFFIPPIINNSSNTCSVNFFKQI